MDNLPSFLAFAEVNIDALQLKLVVANVSTSGINAVFGGHDLSVEKLSNLRFEFITRVDGKRDNRY